MEEKRRKEERIRKIVCVILAVCAAAFLTGTVAERRELAVEAKMSETQKALAQDVLRFHVLANSDSEEDQAVKRKVRDAVLAYMETALAGEEEQDLDDTRAWMEDHLNEIEDVACETLEKAGYSYKARAEVGTSYFPDKWYGDVFFPQGYYEALRVQLGVARGQNWWCVLYPNLCFTDAACTAVEEEGRDELEQVLPEEEYEMVTATSDFQIKTFFFGDLFREN